MIGGNINATIQTKISNKNEIGEDINSWSDIGIVLGWLDYSTGNSDVSKFNAKLQDTDHMFMCDYSRWIDAVQDNIVNSENSRLVVDNNTYEVLLIDDPMNLHQHLEIYLRYVGGGQGV